MRRFALRAFVSTLGFCVAGCRSVPESPHGFAATIGAWEGLRRDVADGTETRMAMRVEPLPGGDGQFRSLDVFGDRRTYHGAAVQRFDPGEGCWVRRYTNSSTRPFARYHATKVDGDRSIWRSVSPGRKRESRLVSEHLPDGLWRRTMSVSADGGRTWRGLWVDELRRRR